VAGHAVGEVGGSAISVPRTQRSAQLLRSGTQQSRAFNMGDTPSTATQGQEPIQAILSCGKQLATNVRRTAILRILTKNLSGNQEIISRTPLKTFSPNMWNTPRPKHRFSFVDKQLSGYLWQITQSRRQTVAYVVKLVTLIVVKRRDESIDDRFCGVREIDPVPNGCGDCYLDCEILSA
jgi:hypothetical protein